jgi:hypothetical protein
MPERKLIADESIRGYVCGVCGWAWPTSSEFSGNSPEQAMIRAFYAHLCSDFPPSHAL